MNYYEISEAPKPNGRRRVKLALHEIYEDNSKYNLNGITYLEKYTKKNAPSIIGMPICASFLDNTKEIPYDHGLTGEDGCMPVFEDSEQVGVADSWSIEDIIINGEEKRVCCCSGYINQQRYPNFVKWLEENQEIGNTVHGSVEFVGTDENKEVVYDGGYCETGRIPMDYEYSGYCILSVKPSDDTAILIELNQFKNKQNESEETTIMDEKIITQITNVVKNTIVETNSKNAESEAKIVELNETITGLNVSIEQLKTALEEVQKEKDELWTKEDILCKEAKVLKEEIAKYEVKAKISELNEVLSDYTDEEKDFAKDEIAQFNEDVKSVEINAIITKIDATIGKKAKAAQISEINSKKSETKIDDIFSSIDSVSTNNAEFLELDGLFV